MTPTEPVVQLVAGWPVWQIMLAEIVVGMHDSRIAIGRKPSRNVAVTIAAVPPELVTLAREQNVTRAARDERPASGPRFVGTVPRVSEPDSYPGSTRRKRQSVADQEAHRGR